jgi:hypothetical protein
MFSHAKEGSPSDVRITITHKKTMSGLYKAICKTIKDGTLKKEFSVEHCRRLVKVLQLRYSVFSVTA